MRNIVDSVVSRLASLVTDSDTVRVSAELKRGTSAMDAIKAIKQAGSGEARDRAQQRETEETLRNLETLVAESARAFE